MKLDDITPRNVAGDQYLEVESIGIFEWHKLPDGQGKPEQVLLEIKLADIDIPLVMRFKSRKPVDSLIMALLTHANSVWGKKSIGDV
jgi:hypothetical protein